MKKVITTTFLVSILAGSGGLPISQAVAAPEAEMQSSQKSTEQGWREALRTQVALTKVKVSLRQAQAKLWLEQNKQAALPFLDKARTSLDKGWQSADQKTRASITELKLQVDQASKLAKEKGHDAEVELRAIADRSESILNSALAQTQARSTALKEETVSHYALAQAKAAALSARIALEIENSPEKAQQALQNAANYLQQVKASTNKITAEQITQLQGQVQAAQQAVSNGAGNAKSLVSNLAVSTEAHISAFGTTLQETEEVKLLKMRYGQLEAKAALLKANLAAKTDATGKQTVAYLDESRAWYDSMKSLSSQRWHKDLSNMSKLIDEAKLAVERKDKQARARLSDLLERATAMFKDEQSAE